MKYHMNAIKKIYKNEEGKVMMQKDAMRGACGRRVSGGVGNGTVFIETFATFRKAMQEEGNHRGCCQQCAAHYEEAVAKIKELQAS